MSNRLNAFHQPIAAVPPIAHAHDINHHLHPQAQQPAPSQEPQTLLGAISNSLFTLGSWAFSHPGQALVGFLAIAAGFPKMNLTQENCDWQTQGLTASQAVNDLYQHNYTYNIDYMYSHNTAFDRSCASLAYANYGQELYEDQMQTMNHCNWQKTPTDTVHYYRHISHREKKRSPEIKRCEEAAKAHLSYQEYLKNLNIKPLHNGIRSLEKRMPELKNKEKLEAQEKIISLEAEIQTIKKRQPSKKGWV